MAESYSLEAILSARDTNFTSTMNGAQKAMGGLGKSASGIGASIGKIATGFGLFKVVSGTISALSSGFSSLTSELNESSIAWQTFESNMAMLGKSSGEIDSTRKSLEKFAQQTIYSASDMAQTYGQMAAIGVEDTERLVKAMGGLAASAENPQQAMKTLSQQMTQAMAKPTLSWADFKLMLEQTPAGMSEVAKEMGYALDDFVVAVQDGEIASKDFAKAVSEVGTNEHFGAMATEFKSVGQAMDGARETIANKLMPAFELLSAIGIKAISGLTDWIDTLDFSRLLAPIESLASMFGIATDEISAMTETIKMSSDEIQSVADNWESMTLTEKQATVQTMGQEDLAELLDMLGVDFESIPDEYTKDAFLNTYGKDSLEEILWVTGKWHDLTLEEKRAVLEAQIDNKGLEEAISNMGLWEDAEFVSKFAEINMNDNDSGQQVLDLINYYRELEGQEPIELEVDVKTKPAEKAIDGFVSTFKKFGKSVGKITKGIGRVMEETGKFFAPVFDFLGDASKASLKTLGKYVDATGQLFEGDWAGAWGTFKDATKEGLISVAGSLKTNMPKMWKNIQGGFNQGVQWISGIGSSIKKWVFDSTQSESWYDVGTWIAGKIGDGIVWVGEVGASMKSWIFESTESETWSDVGEYVMGEIAGGLIEALKLLETALTATVEVITGIIDSVAESYRTWADEHPILSSAIEGLSAYLVTLAAGFSAVWAASKLFALGAAIVGAVSTAMATAVGLVLSPMTLLLVALGAVMVGTYMLWRNWDKVMGWMGDKVDQFVEQVEKIAEAFGQLFSGEWREALGMDPVESEVPVELTYKFTEKENQDDVAAIMDGKINAIKGQFGDITITTGLIIQLMKESGATEAQIDAYLKNIDVDGQQIEVDVEPVSSIEPAGGWLDGVLGSIGDMFKGKTVSAQVDIQPVASSAGGSSSADATGGFTAPEPPKIDFSGMIADAQTAMQTVNQAITTGMTNIASAVRMGTVMMNVAFRSGMNQAVITAQNTANRVLSAFNNLSSNLYSAGVMAGAGFRNGLGSQASSIVSKAQEIADSVSSTIQSALRIASPSKVTTYLGEMVGAGLIAGMDGMVSGVESSANRLSLATLPTTDLGASRYGGSISGQSTSSKLDEVIDAINRGQVIMMDSGALVGETSRQMDIALGQQGSLGGRHKL